MPRFVEFLVLFALFFSVCFGRDDGSFSRLFQSCKDPFVRVIALVGDHGVGFERIQQGVGAFQITCLAGGQVKACRVAESVHGHMDLGAAATTAEPDGFIAPFLSAPALC